MIGKFKFGKKSRDNLYGPVSGVKVRPELVALCLATIADSTIDFTIIDGVRSIEEQKINLRKGFSKTMRSRHLTGHAIDFAPLKKVMGKDVPDWEDEKSFGIIAALFCKKADEMGIRIVSGWRDWKWDLGHIQLDWRAYPVKTK